MSWLKGTAPNHHSSKRTFFLHLAIMIAVPMKSRYWLSDAAEKSAAQRRRSANDAFLLPEVLFCKICFRCLMLLNLHTLLYSSFTSRSWTSQQNGHERKARVQVFGRKTTRRLGRGQFLLEKLTSRSSLGILGRGNCEEYPMQLRSRLKRDGR